MAKRKKKKKLPKTRNEMAGALQSPIFRQRINPDKRSLTKREGPKVTDYEME